MERYLSPFTWIINYFFPRNTNLKKTINELIYFDFETTGLNPFHNKIIEYAFIQEESLDYEDPNEYINNTFIKDLVNPNTKFEKKISDITGIYPDMLEKKKDITYHLPKIMNFINYDYPNTNIYLVAHNCDAFDKLFLITNIKDFNNNKNEEFHIKYKHIKYIDTLNLAKKLLPNTRSFSLTKLSDHFNITSGDHRAMADTICLRKLYHKLMEILSEKLDISKDTLLENPQIVYDYLY